MESKWPIILLLRPHHWTKNFFCFAAILFGGKATNFPLLTQVAFVFAAFCAASSCVYTINDIIDRDRDREHPVKRKRPVASGGISIAFATVIAIVCLVLALLLAAGSGVVVLGLVLVYLALNFAYSAYLKQVVILDVMVISSGFLLRVFAGAAAVHVQPTGWLLLCTFFLALFLGFGKRRAEINSLKENAASSRRVLDQYNETMLDRFCNICATLSIAAYALFTMSGGHDPSLVITCPPVVFGVFRYLYLIERQQKGEAPEVIIFKDLPILAAILIWLMLYAIILYGDLRIPVQ